MNRMLACTTAGLFLGATVVAVGGMHSTFAAGGSNNATTTKQMHYADALLWPYQGGNGANSSNNGNNNVLWQDSNIPGGSFAILSGQGKNLDFILHAKYLQPNQAYTAYIAPSACVGTNSSGAAGGVNGNNGNGNNGSTPLGNNTIGRQTSNAGGAITVTGKLPIKTLPSSFVNGNGNGGNGANNGGYGIGANNGRNGNNAFSVHVVPSSVVTSGASSNKGSATGLTGFREYCGDILTPQAVIPLKSMNGSKAQGIALVSTNGSVWWKSNNTLWGGPGGNKGTQLVVFMQGLAPNAAHEEHIHLGTCASPSEGMIEYPLTDIETDSAGRGVAGTLLNTTTNILNFPSVVRTGNTSSNKSTSNPPSSTRLSLNVHEINFKPAACGDFPYNSGSSKS